MIVPLKFYRSHGVIKGLIISIRLGMKQLIMFPLFIFLAKKKKEILNFETIYPRLKEDEKGKNICIGCELCSHLCPTSAIEISGIDKSKLDIKNRKGVTPSVFKIKVEDCVQCRLCISICPVSALTKDFAREI